MSPTNASPRALSIFLPAVCASLLVGECTGTDPGEIGIVFAVYGACISGALVLLFGALVIAARSGPAFLAWVVVSSGTYLGMLAAVNMGLSSAGGFFLVQGLAVLVVALVIGMVLGHGRGFIQGTALVLVGAVATLYGLASLFGAYLSSADICIGYFGVDCGSTDQIDWLRFAVLAGIGPALIAIVPAVLAWMLCTRNGKARASLSDEVKSP